MYNVICSGVWDDEKEAWNPQAYDGLDQHTFDDLIDAIKAVDIAAEVKDDDVVTCGITR